MKALVKSLMEAVAGRYGYEMRREPSIVEFLHVHGVDLVIDVGANEGQFAAELRRGGYKGAIHSFEPVAAVFAHLERGAARDPLWQATRTALGKEAGEATINVSAFSQYSSLRAVTAFGHERDDNMRVLATEQVAVARLDDLIAHEGRSVFLKIDTQGFEREVLGGAESLLTRCIGLQLELPIAHLYEGVWDFDEAIGHMKALGFVPAQFRTVGTSAATPASAVEVDCVFRRL